MTSSTGPDRAARTARGPRMAWLAGTTLLLLLFLASCGPGVGGTGTGTGASVGGLDDFGAAPSPLCAASFAAALDCPVAGGASAPGTPAVGGARRQAWIDAATGGQRRLQLDGQRAALDARCERLGFEGEWGVTPAGAARFFGSTLADGALARQPAVLELQPGAAAAELLLTLRDAGGVVLLGPLALRAAAPGDAPPAACP